MKTFDDKLALITGAGSGIGRATALALFREGARLALVDRDARGLDETLSRLGDRSTRARSYVVDVTDVDAMRELARRVESELGVLDILVNNAGIGAGGRFLDTSLETWRRVLDVNVMGVVHGCHVFLPSMVARGEGGHVVNLSSLAGYVAPRDMPVYSASKFAVLGFSESLRADMAEHGIGVTAICPGVINTSIIGSTILEGAGAVGARDRIRDFYARRDYGPERVAEVILDAIRRNDAVRPVSPESWVMYYAKRAVPGLVRRLGETKNPFEKP